MLLGINVPYAKYVSYGVFIGEVVAPLLLIFGQYIKVSSSIVAFNMFVAIVLVHKDTIFTLGEHGGWSIEVPMLYLVIALALIFWKEEKHNTYR
jgi:putative oxidoreductase